MAFFGRLFATRGSDPYQTGLALCEQGKDAEAIPLLRSVYQGDPRSPRGSLAGLQLRQALVTEARRLLQIGRTGSAIELLNEAVGHWPEFPDLQFLNGAAQALDGRWSAALEAARAALRRNPDYCEARLLEACSLQGLQRPNEARASLQALVESGRRVDHGLVAAAKTALATGTDAVVADHLDLLRRIALGDDAKRRLGEAVALCRAGQWSQCLEHLADLGRRYPHYPDVRARHAAVLYQTGEIAAALQEAEAALAINPRYRTAVSLKGLILAERGELQTAHDYLAETVPGLEGLAGRHEELFLAYLRAVLALLCGDPATCRTLLEAWHDLPRQFARAALLQAAADDLAGWPDAALRRLEELVRIWPADAELVFLRTASLLRQGQLAAAEAQLVQWPGGAKGLKDSRPLLLRARLNVAQGREPLLPTEPLAVQDPVGPAAWRQLAMIAHLLRGETEPACAIGLELLEQGLAEEETARLLIEAATQAGRALPDDLSGRCGPADSWAIALARHWRRSQREQEAEDLIRRRRAVRPDLVQWSWLSASFWLDPVRRWLA